jgi:hypothetical protein
VAGSLIRTLAGFALVPRAFFAAGGFALEPCALGVVGGRIIVAGGFALEPCALGVVGGRIVVARRGGLLSVSLPLAPLELF